MKKRKTLLFQYVQNFAADVILEAYITAKLMKYLNPIASKSKLSAIACAAGSVLTSMAITDALTEMLNESYRHGNATLSVVDDIFYMIDQEKAQNQKSNIFSILDFNKEK